MLSTISHYLTETVIVTVNITATPKSILTDMFDDLSENCTDSTDLVHLIIWPVLAVLVAIFFIFSIVVYLCAKSAK